MKHFPAGDRDDIEANIFVPVDGKNVILCGFENQASLFSAYKFFRFAVSITTSGFDFNEHQQFVI